MNSFASDVGLGRRVRHFVAEPAESEALTTSSNDVFSLVFL